MICYTVMVADILHKGHINILKTCSLYGEVVVGLMTDEAAESYKRKPLLGYEDRKSVLESVKYVSMVVPQESMSYRKNILLYQPNYVVNGDDWKTSEKWLKYRYEVIVLLNQWGGVLIEPKYTEGISTTLLISSIGNRLQEIQASSSNTY